MRISFYLLFYCLTVFTPITVFCQEQEKINRVLGELKGATDDTGKVKKLYYVSRYLLTSEPDKSLEYAKQTLALAQKLNYQQYIFNAYQTIGGYYYYRTNLPMANQYFTKALKVAEGMGDKQSLGKVYSNLSLLGVKQLDYNTAIDYSERAMKLAGELKDTSLTSAITLNRAILYINLSDYPTALNYALKALRLNEEKDDKSKMTTNHYYLGYIYMLGGDYEKALEYFHLSINTAKESNDRFQLAQSLDKIGEVYYNKQDWSRALDYFHQAITIGREVGSFDNIISATQNIALIYSEQGKYAEAMQSVNNALQLSQQVGDEMGTGNNYWYLGSIAMKKHDYKTAISNLEKSRDIAVRIKSKENEAAALMDMVSCYNALQDYPAAYKRLLEYNAVKDSIISNATIKNTAEISAKYQLEKKEKEIALLTKDKQIQALEIKKQTFLKNSFIACLSLAVLLFFFVFRNYRTMQLLKLQTLRNKIASDLHDEVGSTLSSISIFSDIARQQSKDVAPMLEQINDSSHKMLESMADIVWTINPENDNFEKVILRMRSFAFELLGAKKIDFEFDSDESLDKLELSMDVRKNLYLIFKEATNNIVKYADADRASFSISNSNNMLTMLIRDNGKGFEVEKQTIGNGLKNMKNRANEIGARFLIESEAGKGTTIQLTLKAA